VQQTPAAVCSKDMVHSRLTAWIAVSNPAEDIFVVSRLMCIAYVVATATNWSHVRRSPTKCVCVCVCVREREREREREI
jgi:hypothetical protein